MGGGIMTAVYLITKNATKHSIFSPFIWSIPHIDNTGFVLIHPHTLVQTGYKVCRYHHAFTTFIQNKHWSYKNSTGWNSQEKVWS